MESGKHEPESELGGYSFANFGPIVFPCLDAVRPASVLEVGAYSGDFTGELLAWAKREGGARVTAIEPEPPPELLALAERHPELRLVSAPSLDALRELEPAGVVIIDGDHNYYTLSEELRLIEERSGDTGLPLLMLHDVGWPHARRDSYYAPERIPEQHRQPLARNGAVVPGDPGIARSGLRYPWVAAREGGPRNGVLTALEDFVEDREGLSLAIVPGFFGLGVLWSSAAPWAGAVAEIVEPWDGNPLLERLEDDRLMLMVDRIRRLQEHEVLLRQMLGSRALGVAEWVSRLNQRGRPVFSRERVRRALDG